MWERIYAIYDRQARQPLKGNIPFVMMYQNDMVARREFTDMVRQIPQLQKHADDYILIYCGRLNTETLQVEPSSAFPAEDLTCLTMTARDALHQDARQLDLGDERNQKRKEERGQGATQPQDGATAETPTQRLKISKEEFSKTK